MLESKMYRWRDMSASARELEQERAVMQRSIHLQTVTIRQRRAAKEKARYVLCSGLSLPYLAPRPELEPGTYGLTVPGDGFFWDLLIQVDFRMPFTDQ